jgi:DNA-directed RNA polymerase specialized sigma24 family protein
MYSMVVAMQAVLRGADEVAIGRVVDEHYGAMHRFARLVGHDPDTAHEAVRAAWRSALERPEGQPPGLSSRGWLLGLVVEATAPPEPPAEGAPAASPDNLEDPNGRWAGWWKDDQAKTPSPEPKQLDATLAAMPPALAALLILRDVERLSPDEVETVLGYAPDQQLLVLQHARTALRNELRAGALS